MTFQVPSFPLTVDFYTGPWATKAFRFSTTGNLGIGRRIGLFDAVQTFSPLDGSAVAQLLLPVGTDVHSECQGNPQDIVEVPSGSGRWYQVNGFEDVAKGFPNEYRLAVIFKIYEHVDGVPGQYTGLFWPTPTP